MNRYLALLVLLTSVARADIFEFKDLEGYEKCLATDHVAEHTKTSSGAQSRFLNAVDVQLRCVESAGKLMSSSKNKETMKDFIKTTKRMTAQENAIELVQSIVKTDVNTCNDLEVYEVIAKALSHPKVESSASNFQKARKVTKACLKNKEFKKDFTEEKDASDTYLQANACEILVEEKIVSSCKKG